MDTQVIQATPADAGCWVEGSRGQYAITYMIHVATLHGYVLSDNDREAVDLWNTGRPDADLESVVEIADEAEAWLNEHVAPAGFSFGWHDGEFFLWPLTNWAYTD